MAASIKPSVSPNTKLNAAPIKPGTNDASIRSSTSGGPGTNVVLRVSVAPSRNPIDAPPRPTTHRVSIAVGELLSESCRPQPPQTYLRAMSPATTTASAGGKASFHPTAPARNAETASAGLANTIRSVSPTRMAVSLTKTAKVLSVPLVLSSEEVVLTPPLRVPLPVSSYVL